MHGCKLINGYLVGYYAVRVVFINILDRTPEQMFREKFVIT